LEHSWYEFLQGHTLVSIANRLPTSCPDLDALIITGGDDHPVRNQVEHELIDRMLACNIPVIGICHGCQLLTTKLGGSVTSVDEHMDRDHEVEYRGQPHLVNSYHTLRIQQLPEGATVLARDLDGHAEAWISGRTAGIMWHPERMTHPWIPEEIQHLLN
jgi:gamma-glutamyl-gamma-aminobutyrate hydrolase PuuD